MDTGTDTPPRERRWHPALWAGATLLWLLPLAAMQFSDQVAWDAGDFALFGAMLVVACGAYEAAARTRRDRVYRAAVGLALVTAFLLVWLTLAVGLFGSEHERANVMVAGVLAVAGIGALAAGLQPRAMARAMLATALAQGAAAVIAPLAGLGSAWVLSGLFVALWLAAAALFGKANPRT